MKKVFTALCLLMLLCACSNNNEEVHKDFFAMDTYMSVTAYGRAASSGVQAAEAEINRLEQLLSATEPESEVALINSHAGETVTVSQETADLIALALEMAEQTGGKLDISVHPVFEAWGFFTREYRIPQAAELAALLKKVDYHAVRTAGDAVKIEPGMGISLGSIAKGYAGDRAAVAMAECGVESALISLGGDVQTLGRKPDGELWRIALQNPENDTYLGVISVENSAVVTSGTYERYFEENGVTYHHIIDPATGYPASQGLSSVTIVCESAAVADGFATAFVAMGMEAAAQVWQAADDFEVIFVTQDNKIYITEGLENNFESAGDNYWIIRKQS